MADTDNTPVERRMRQVLPKLEFSGIALADAIQFLRDVSNCCIYVKWPVLQAQGIEKSNPVNVKLTDVTFGRALQTILYDVGGLIGLGFVVDEGVITVSTIDDLSRFLSTRVYPINDLLLVAKEFDGRRNDLNTVADRLVDSIRASIGPGSWEPSGLGSLRHLNGILIVTQSIWIHQAIESIIAHLRVSGSEFRSFLAESGHSGQSNSEKSRGKAKRRVALLWALVVLFLVLVACLVCFGWGLTMLGSTSHDTRLDVFGVKLTSGNTGLILVALGLAGGILLARQIVPMLLGLSRGGSDFTMPEQKEEAVEQ